MKKYSLIISPEAEIELKVSVEFYEQKRKGLGEDFLKEIDKTLNRVLSNPEHFQIVAKKQFRKANLKRFPFGIFFAVKDAVINVLAVFHFSRNPEQLRRR